MLSKITSCATLGIEGHIVEVEVDVAHGLPSYNTVGLPDVAVRESRERVKSAIVNSGFKFPTGRITVNLAPADMKKEGPIFDLPIAIGILSAGGVVNPLKTQDYVITGELSLDGTVRSIKGVLPMAIAVRRENKKGIIVPYRNRIEASLIGDIDVIPILRLSEAIGFLNGSTAIMPYREEMSSIFKNNNSYDLDFSEVKGQEHAKRALEIAAAGGHNILTM